MLWQHKLILASITFSLAIIIVAFSTGPTEPRPPMLPEAVATRNVAQPRLVDESLERGIFHLHSQISDSIAGLDEALGSGACAFDMDRDRDMDLYLVGGSGHLRFYGKPSWWSKKRTGRLYRNLGDGFFEDVTEQSGLDVTLWGMGCNAADFNLDGYVDLLVTGRNANYLWQNLDGRQFEPVDFEGGADWSTSAALGDYNDDGKMDIYIANFLAYDNAARRFEGLSGYETSHAEFGSENYPAVANRLLTNRGDFRFDETAKELGVDNSDGRSLSAKWFDFDGDRRLDLLVMNDSGSTTRLYLNQPDTAFTPASLNQRLELPSGIRGGALQDFDADGDADLVLSTRLGESAVLFTNRQGEYANLFWQRHRDGNRFVGLSGYGLQFADLNNDGELDIFHANGLGQPDPDAPAVSAGQPDLISLGDGRGNFVPANSDPGQDWHLPLSSRTVISVDVDNDGDKDLLVTANNNPARLLVNHAPLDHWIGFDLEDRHGNPGNFEKLELVTNLQQKTYFADADTLLGRHDDRVSQALLPEEVVKTVIIHWRDGDSTELESPATNAYHVVEQGKAETTQYRRFARKPARLPPRLALWLIKSGGAGRGAALRSFRIADEKTRLEMIDAIASHDPDLKLLAVLQSALNDEDSDVVQAGIASFRRLELESSYYWLAGLFQHSDPRILCALANTFRHFYIEEEAMVQRKVLAVPHLLQLLGHGDQRVVTCATLALAESKNYRAVVPIEQLLLSSDDAGVLNAAVYALGELRRTRSIDAILSLATEDADLRRARSRALGQLNVRPGIEVPADTDRNAAEASASEPPCPERSAAEIISLPAEALAGSFDSCSALQQQHWFELNRTNLEPHAAELLDNQSLAPETYALMVRALARSSAFEITKMLISHLHRHRGIVEDSALILALEQRLPQKGLEKLLKSVLKNRANPRQLRIAAGDVLIDIDPGHVMQYANELFDE